MLATACLNGKLQNSLSLHLGWGMQIKLPLNALSSLFKVLSEVRTRKRDSYTSVSHGKPGKA